MEGWYHAQGRYNGSIGHSLLGKDLSLGPFAAGAEMNAEKIINLELPKHDKPIDNFGLLTLLEEVQLFETPQAFPTAVTLITTLLRAASDSGDVFNEFREHVLALHAVCVEPGATQEESTKANVWVGQSNVVAMAKKYLEESMPHRGEARLLASFRTGTGYNPPPASLTGMIHLIESKLSGITEEPNRWRNEKEYARNDDGVLRTNRDHDEPSTSSLVRAVGKLFQTIVRDPTRTGSLLDVTIALHVLQHLATGKIPPVVDACEIKMPDSRPIDVPVLVVTDCESDDAQALFLLQRNIPGLKVLIQAAPEKVDGVILPGKFSKKKVDEVILPQALSNESVYVYREPLCKNQQEVDACNKWLGQPNDLFRKVELNKLRELDGFEKLKNLLREFSGSRAVVLSLARMKEIKEDTTYHTLLYKALVEFWTEGYGRKVEVWSETCELWNKGRVVEPIRQGMLTVEFHRKKLHSRQLPPGSGDLRRQPPHLYAPDLAEQIVRAALDRTSLPLPMLLSGACSGADELFGDMAMRARHRVVHFLGPRDLEWASDKAKAEQEHAFFKVEKELLDGPIVSEAFDRASRSRVLGSERAKKGWEKRVADMSARRNFLQVRCADAVYAVGWRLQPGKDQFTGQKDIAREETPALDVGGGTGWACQCYADRFGEGGEDPRDCHLYLFDQGGPPWAREDSVTAGKWNEWNAQTGQWKPMMKEGPRKPWGLYAGIGATSLTDESETAIRELYANQASQAPDTGTGHRAVERC